MQSASSSGELPRLLRFRRDDFSLSRIHVRQHPAWSQQYGLAKAPLTDADEHAS